MAHKITILRILLLLTEFIYTRTFKKVTTPQVIVEIVSPQESLIEKIVVPESQKDFSTILLTNAYMSYCYYLKKQEEIRGH